MPRSIGPIPWDAGSSPYSCHMAHLGRDQVKPLRKISVSLLCEVFTSSSLSTKTFGFWLLRGVRAADRARCSMALIGQRILSCSAVPTAAALLPTAVSLAAPALAAFLAAAHWLHGVTFVEGGCVQCPGGPGAEPWSAGALAMRCLRHGHSRCCVVCAQCSGLDACAWHFTRTLCKPWWFPSGCFVLAATVLLVLLCFTGSDCVLHQLPRVLCQPRQIRTRANPSCAPIPRVLGSPASSMSASRVAWFQLGLPCE